VECELRACHAPRVISPFEPSERDLEAFRARQEKAPFSYPEVGATREKPPPGYHVDEAEFEVGRGTRDFERACAGLRSFVHFTRHVRIVPPIPKLEVGAVVVLRTYSLGLHTVSACRVVYLIEGPRRFGYAYGTLEHAVRGEEVFELRHDDDDAVRFRLLAFSVPDHVLVRLGAPFARRFQKIAGEGYGDALRAHVAGSSR
jgi:uncharacterized protein (UPF0548 family)